MMCWRRRFSMVSACVGSYRFTRPFFRQISELQRLILVYSTYSDADPLGIKVAFVWMTRLISIQPRRITPQLIHTFLLVCGNKMMTANRTEGEGLVRHITGTLFNQIPPEAKPAAMRLELFLKETLFSAKGQIPPCPGSKLETRRA
jgi:hypothetical protein